MAARLIDANGKFNGGIQRDLELDKEISPLNVVSIIGAQSCGKSTLLNCMFGTEFEEFDAERGGPRLQTTKGIWVAKISSGQDCILVIDTEGSDGQEREGDETFARQTALFAMAISRVVIINMMCTEVGRESGGGWPILRAACESKFALKSCNGYITNNEVMLQKFMTAHQVTFLFVLRDKTNVKSDEQALKNQIKDEMQKILNRMTGPQAQANARLSHLFKIKVETTSCYLAESERPNFISEVDKMRDWIISYTTSNKSTSERIPTSSFTTYAQEIWDKIKMEKDLNLPAFRIMVAQVHCKRIAMEQRDRFRKDEKWLQIEKKVESGSIIQGFGKEVSSLISTYESQYEENAKIHEKTTRDEHGNELTAKLLEIIRPTYDCLVDRMESKIEEDFRKAALYELSNKGIVTAEEVQDFITKFDYQLKDAHIKQANWTHAFTRRANLLRAMNSFIAGANATNTKIDEMNTKPDETKTDRKSWWKKIAEAILTVIRKAASVLVDALLSALSAAGVPDAIANSVLKMFVL